MEASASEDWPAARAGNRLNAYDPIDNLTRRNANQLVKYCYRELLTSHQIVLIVEGIDHRTDAVM